MAAIIGVDIGGTSLKAAWVGGEGEYGRVHTLPTPAGDGLLGALERLVDLCRGDAPGVAAGIGVGCPGIVARDGTVLLSNNLRLDRFPLAATLSRRLGLPVAVLNDALCATLAEYRLGAGRGAQDLAMLTIGTGVGVGLVLRGELYTGHNGCTAGGHLITVSGGRPCTCGSAGCWETVASASALSRYGREEAAADGGSLLCAEPIDGERIFAAAARGDAAASRAIGRWIAALGDGVAGIMNLLRPERIVIGGGVSARGEAVTGPLDAYVAARLFIGPEAAPYAIVPAALGNFAGIVGAALYADAACGLGLFERKRSGAKRASEGEPKGAR